MGFYQPAQIVRNAKEHGVKILPVDINHSGWDNTLEAKSGNYHALRLGFREINGIREEEMQLLINARTKPFTQPHQLCDAGLTVATLERLAKADAFRSIGLDRRQALWEVAALHDRPTGLYEGQRSQSEFEPQVKLPFMQLSEHVVQDYATTGLSIKGHPVGFIRNKLNLFNVLSTKLANDAEDKKVIKVAGLVLVRQRPGTAKGVCFITIEDEQGQCNLVVFPKLFDKYRKEIEHSRLLMVEGTIQRAETVHVIVRRCIDYTTLLGSLTAIRNDQQPVLTLSRADEKASPFIPIDKTGQVRRPAPEDYLDKGRNFK